MTADAATALLTITLYFGGFLWVFTEAQRPPERQSRPFRALHTLWSAIERPASAVMHRIMRTGH